MSGCCFGLSSHLRFYSEDRLLDLISGPSSIWFDFGILRGICGSVGWVSITAELEMIWGRYSIMIK